MRLTLEQALQYAPKRLPHWTYAPVWMSPWGGLHIAQKALDNPEKGMHEHFRAPGPHTCGSVFVHNKERGYIRVTLPVPNRDKRDLTIEGRRMTLSQRRAILRIAEAVHPTSYIQEIGGKCHYLADRQPQLPTLNNIRQALHLQEV